LDRTIEALGKEKVEETLQQFRKAQMEAQDHCAGKVFGLCSNAGATPIEKNTCYIWAEGCDHQCLDSLTLPNDL
jgi:hypothetical protein